MKGNPQIEDGYTRVANELLQAIFEFKFGGLKLAIIMAVIRSTYGFGKVKSELSIGYLAKLVGGDYQQVAIAVRELIKDSVLTEYSKPGFSTKRVLGINKKYNEWSIEKRIDYVKTNRLCKNHKRGLCKNQYPDKENGFKENIIIKDERVKIIVEALENTQYVRQALSGKNFTKWVENIIELFPEVDFKNEILKAESWLIENPEEHKKKHTTFLRNWFEKSGKYNQSGSNNGRYTSSGRIGKDRVRINSDKREYPVDVS